MYQNIEETGGSMNIEGFEQFIGCDKAGSLRLSIAVAPGLAKHTTEKLTAEVEILKQRRNAIEEAAAAKRNNGDRGDNNNNTDGGDPQGGGGGAVPPASPSLAGADSMS